MRARLLTGFALLFVGMLIIPPVLPWAIQRHETNYQSMRQKGWTTYLDDPLYLDPGLTNYLGAAAGQVLLDRRGTIWISGGPSGMTGLHAFDGRDWTHHAGNYWDLAEGPGGEIWAVSPADPRVHVFDGQEWKEYEREQLGLGEQEITRVEVDSQGQVWLVTREWEGKNIDHIHEITLSAVGIPSLRHVSVVDGYLDSFEADRQGRIWAAVNRSFPKPDATGIHVFDGETFQRLPDQPGNLKNSAGAAPDQQGNVWAVTQCSGVVKYDGKEWITMVADDSTPYCFQGTPAVRGMILDRHDRLWAWSYESVKFLEDDRWTLLTPENSGLAGTPFGVVVDAQDRVWIGTSGGVSVAPFRNIQPLPARMVNAHRAWSYIGGWVNGMIWFLPSMAAILWLATYFDLLSGVLIAVISGMLVIGVGVGLIGPGNNGADTLVVQAGVVGSFAGILGGFIGGWIDKHPKRTGRPRSAVGLALTGVVLGSLFGLFFIWIRIMAGG